MAGLSVIWIVGDAITMLLHRQSQITLGDVHVMAIVPTKRTEY